MRLKFLSLLAATLLLAACGSTPEESADTTGGGSSTSTTSPSLGTTSQALPGPEAGSQEDLAVNVGDRVLFDTDRSDLSPSARATVEALAVWLKSFPAITMTVEGHADERGTREYNLALGERRANSVQDYLIALGINPNRISTISFGKERPLVPGSNEEAWQQNRRAAFIVN